MPPTDCDQARWFAEHVQPHEPMLRAWLQSRFPQSDEVDDILQESYLRILQARQHQDLQSPKAFLYAVARNFALDRLRRRQVAGVPVFSSVESLDLLDETDGIPETVARNQELELLTEAIQSLPERCRQIFTLRKIYGLSQDDIATKFGISKNTVSAQLTKGVQRCTEILTRWRQRDASHS